MFLVPAHWGFHRWAHIFTLPVPRITPGSQCSRLQLPNRTAAGFGLYIQGHNKAKEGAGAWAGAGGILGDHPTSETPTLFGEDLLQS